MTDPQDKRFLPAPYQSPWEALRRDLAAVLADLRLRTQELWRRNRDGDLDVPAVWPRDLAPLFWPVLLGLVLLAVVSVLVVMARVIPIQQSSVSPGDAVAQRTAPPIPAPAIADTTSVDDGEPVDPTTAKPATAGAITAQPADVLPPDEPSAAAHQGAAPLPAASQPVADDPLLVTLQQWVDSSGGGVDVAGLVVALTRRPERNAVQLSLAESWRTLNQSRRQQLADQLLEQIQAAGYDDLLLQSAQGDAWGRSARVGQGMVIPEPEATAKT